MLVFKQVSKYYKNTIGIENLSFSIEQGEFVFLIGKTGAGKSTLLKLITKQLEPSQGDIIAYNLSLRQMKKKNIPYYRRLLGIIDIQTSLLYDRDVYDNIAIAMIAVGQSEKAMQENIPRVLNIVGMHNKMYDYPDTLSGGEIFRVHLARAIINNPKIIIADEPTAHLDYHSAWEIMMLLNDIHLQGCTVIISTHAHEFVTVMKKRVITLHKGHIESDSAFQGKGIFYE